MITTDVKHLIAELSAGRRLIVLVIDGTTNQSASTPVGSTAASAAVAVGAPSSGEPQAAQNSPLAVAERVESSSPDVRWTAAEWSTRLGGAISVRELQRAIQFGAITAGERGKGRGHGALVISPSAMVEFLVVRENGRHSREGRPGWYNDVVKELRRAA